jgi:hypothetical protein
MALPRMVTADFRDGVPSARRQARCFYRRRSRMKQLTGRRGGTRWRHPEQGRKGKPEAGIEGLPAEHYFVILTCTFFDIFVRSDA